MNGNDVIMSYVGEGKMKINPSKITSIYEAQSRCNIKTRMLPPLRKRQP